jgi:Domain of unknown function (DUF4349)
MRIITSSVLLAASLVLFGCSFGDKKATTQNASALRQTPDQLRAASLPDPVELGAKSALSKALQTTISGQQQQVSQVSLAEAAAVQAATFAADRKIIRNCELTIETDSPSDGLRKITSIAESNGGFVVTSEFKHNDGAGQTKPTQTVTVVARVPASQFGFALEQIRSAGNRVIQEKVSGQDVSEEYLDLEARIRTKKALEAQFLEIMKQARKVSDALEVQSQLADVRTEIERLEGRRRFLENQSALSTITATLQMPQPIIAATTSGFGSSIKRSFGDAVDVAASIVLFIIQAVIVLAPIAVLFGLPGWIVWRTLRRRVTARRVVLPSAIPTE